MGPQSLNGWRQSAESKTPNIMQCRRKSQRPRENREKLAALIWDHRNLRERWWISRQGTSQGCCNPSLLRAKRTTDRRWCNLNPPFVRIWANRLCGKSARNKKRVEAGSDTARPTRVFMDVCPSGLRVTLARLGATETKGRCVVPRGSAKQPTMGSNPITSFITPK